MGKSRQTNVCVVPVRMLSAGWPSTATTSPLSFTYLVSNMAKALAFRQRVYQAEIFPNIHHRITTASLQSWLYNEELCDAGLGSPRLLGCAAAEFGDEPHHSHHHWAACASQLTAQRDDYERIYLYFKDCEQRQ